jgi:Na+-driven multidrug efflux pump
MKTSFFERRFYSMLLTGTFTTAVIYIMRLSDSIIAGIFLGEAGVAGINAVEPITGVIAFFTIIISFGTAILYSREIGAMRKDRANELFGQGLIVSVALAAVTALVPLPTTGPYPERIRSWGPVIPLS